MSIDLYSLGGGMRPQRHSPGPFGGSFVDAPTGGSVRVDDSGRANFEAGGARSYGKLFDYVDSVAPGVRLANPGVDDDGSTDFSKVSADGASQLAAALTSELESGRAESRCAADHDHSRGVNPSISKITELRDFLLVCASDGGYEAF